ncbi:hypothetical protein [Sulfuriroseicoccus oceanibius]|uniref:Uncharacterized protein n=1 Tax=Sulfuriroseicoccus oceanibius TaxID=2707525 RepID=A0A6B3LEI5_9BACT|nr:hypothetical protein [Sulfuriroseicoccus oceanibius]QQL44611.1 hypothetical protein G3M56_012070 [Sulfuriroseicoccus oceanibius]
MFTALKRISLAIKRLFLALAGALGGGVVAILLSLLLFHLRTTYALDISPLGTKITILSLACIAAGIIAPRHFAMFFIAPLSWILNADDSGGGAPLETETSTSTFMLNVSYMLGLALFPVGALFSLPWIAGIGFAGILIFSLGVFRFGLGNPVGEQAGAANRDNAGCCSQDL